MKYDYLVVGAGLFGATFVYEARKHGKTCIVIDKRDHIAGNIYCAEEEGILIHRYGAHIFHTSDEEVWEFVNQFVSFNNFINSPVAVYKDELYNLPFNMNTFSRMWDIRTPAEAKAIIARQIRDLDIDEPKNLEEQALKLVGRDVYEKLIKGYTEKQWGRPCTELPAFIIKRLPLRFVYDNNYFRDPHQGTVYTGMIDEYYDFCFGNLEYRSVRFEDEHYNTDNYQGNAVVNYTESVVPYTRIIEHKHFAFGTQPTTIISKEYPSEWRPGVEPYYPINDEKNNALYEKYRALAEKEEKVIFGGRLGTYKYYDMDKVIAAALAASKKEFGE